jgi:hypothetical protein
MRLARYVRDLPEEGSTTAERAAGKSLEKSRRSAGAAGIWQTAGMQGF